MKLLLEKILSIMARALLAKYKPRVVGVTGSVGKTTTKSAIAAVLSAKFRTRENIKSYNNEIGLPLTILGAESPARSLAGWFRIFFSWLWRMMIKDKTYPEALVLEMGADSPGDIRALTNLAPCDVAVLTAIGPTHLEQFETVEEVAKEKRIIIETIKKGGAAILNADDERVIATPVEEGIERISYGTRNQPDIDVRATDVHLKFNLLSEDDNREAAMNFKVSYQGSSVPVFLPNVVGTPAVSAALGAIAVGLAFDMNLLDITKALTKYVSPPGRLKVLPGIKHTTIIDDTYNSSPRASTAAIELLSKIEVGPSRHRYAVLGDMLELGAETEARHEAVGQSVAEHKISALITVGERARTIARSAREHGMAPEGIFSFSKAEEAGNFLKERIQEGDVALIKGSQGMRMERTVLHVMADPEHAKDLLVRQSAEWVDR